MDDDERFAMDGPSDMDTLEGAEGGYWPGQDEEAETFGYGFGDDDAEDWQGL